MFTAAFWKDTGVRTIRTGAAILLTIIGADGAGIVGLDLDGTATLTLGGMLATVLAAVSMPTADQKLKNITYNTNTDDAGDVDRQSV